MPGPFLEITHHYPWEEADKSVRPTQPYLVVAAAEVVDEHLFNGFVIGHQDVADGAAADDVADFLGEILGVIASALDGLGHEDDLQARLASEVFGILDVAKKDEIAQAVDLSVGAENSTALPTSRAEKASPTSVSIFSRMVAMWVRSRVSSESTRPAAA